MSRIALPAALLAVLAFPAVVAAAWTTPTTLSGAGQHADLPQVAVDPSGNAVFVWKRLDGTTDCRGGSPCYRIQARARSAAGVLSAIQTLSDPGADATAPQVGVDQGGNAVFVWQRHGFVEARARSATGVLSATQTLSNPDPSAGTTGVGYAPQVAVDPSGNAVFVWQRFDGTTGCGGSAGCLRVQARARSAAGALSAIQTLTVAGQSALVPDVSVDQSGNAVIVWDRFDGAGCEDSRGCLRIQVRARSAAGTLSAIQTLSDPGQHAGGPRVAVDPGGDAIIGWSRNDGTGGCSGISPTGCSRVQAVARSATGDLSATETLSAADHYAGLYEVGIDQDGDAIFAWEFLDGTTGCPGFPDPGCLRIQARARSAAGVLSATQTLSGPGLNATIPRVAVDQGGDAVFVWRRRDGTTDCGGLGCFRIHARARAAAGALSATQIISPPGQDANIPQVGVDQSGNAVAVWRRFDGTNPDPQPGCCWRIQAAAGP